MHVQFFAVFGNDCWVQYDGENAAGRLIVDLNPFANHIYRRRHL